MAEVAALSMVRSCCSPLLGPRALPSAACNPTAKPESRPSRQQQRYDLHKRIIEEPRRVYEIAGDHRALSVIARMNGLIWWHFQKSISFIECCSLWWRLQSGTVHLSLGFSPMPVCGFPFSSDAVRTWAASVSIPPQMQQGNERM
jgi:hypothetical protein